MNQVVEKLKSTTFGGRRFTRSQIKQIQSTVNSLPHVSRRELANTICEQFNWLTPSGKNRSQACLNALEKMEAQNLFCLPAKVEFNARGKKKSLIWTSSTNEQARIEEELNSILPIQLIPAVDLADCKLWNEYVDRYHYLGYKHPIGQNLRYFIVDNHSRKLGCLSFSLASRVLRDRDNWIGWGIKARQKRLHLVINNNRYLIFPWVDIKNLASKALSMACQQLPNDWDSLHGYKPLLVETFVDTEKYKGTCYQAANWKYIGKTDGTHRDKNGERKSIKEIYVYPLEKKCQTKLINGEKIKRKRKSTPAVPVNNDNEDAFIQSWQRIISTIASTCEDFDLAWRKRKRLINTLLLVLFIFRLVFSKNKQGYQITIAELWHQCQLMGVKLPQKAPIAASAFCAARTKLDENIFKVINAQIIDFCEVSGENDNWHGRRVFAVDGTKMNLPRALLKNGYKLPHENSHYPFGLVSCLYQLRSKVPVDFDLMPGTGERTYALAHLTKLTEGDVVVYDRGYFSYAMLYWHHKKKIHPVFRMPYQTYPAIVEFIDSEKTNEIVDILLTREKFTKIRKKDPNVDVQSLKLRLIKYRIGDETYTLGTTLFDKEFDDIKEFSALYNERWDIEELYKISKVLIEVQDFHSKSERGIKQELYAHFVMITLSRVFTNHIENVSFQKLNDEVGRETRVNMKNCLTTIARNLEALFIQQRMIVKTTIDEMINSIAKCRQKERPNRSYERRSKKPFSKWQASKNTKKSNLTPVM